MTRVIVVDDYSHTREWCAHLIKESGRYHLIGSFSSALNAEIPCTTGKVDLLIMDICTEDGESGLKAAEILKQKYPNIKIIIMTSMPEHSFVKRAKAAGCESFWYKESDVDLIDIMDRTMAGESVWPDSTPVIMIGLARSDEFTDRELDVIRALVGGSRYEDIGQALCMSANTVKYHVKNILQKTGFRSTIQLVAEVVEKRLILPKY